METLELTSNAWRLSNHPLYHTHKSYVGGMPTDED